MCQGLGFFSETAALRSAYRLRDGKKKLGWLRFRRQNISPQTLIRRTHVHTEEPLSRSETSAGSVHVYLNERSALMCDFLYIWEASGGADRREAVGEVLE